MRWEEAEERIVAVKWHETIEHSDKVNKKVDLRVSISGKDSESLWINVTRF